MNFKKILPISSLILGFLGICISTSSFIIEKTQAAFISNVSVSDSFDTKKLSDEWVSSGVSTSIDHSSMRFHPTKYDWGGHIQLDKHPITQSTVIEIEMSTSTNEGWLALSFGGATSTSSFTSVNAALVFFTQGESGGQFFRMEDGELRLKSDTSTSPFQQLDQKKILQAYAIRNSTNWSIYYDVLNSDRTMFYQHKNSEIFTCDDASGYVGFNNSLKDCELYSFKMLDYFDPSNVFYYDDFLDTSITYYSSGDGIWKSSSFEKEDIDIGPVAKLDISTIGSYATYYAPYVNAQSEKIDICSEYNFSINYSKMDLLSQSGIEICKPDMDSAGYFFGIQRKTSGYTLIACDQNRENVVKADSSVDPSGSELYVSVKVHNDGSVNFVSSATGVNYSVSSPNGYFSFTSISLDSTGTSGGLIDNFSLNVATDLDRSTSDVATSFEGVKETKIFDDSFYEYFIPKTEWYYSNDTSLPIFDNYLTREEQNGYIQFDASSGRTLFGSKNKYYEYIVKADVEIITDVPDLLEGAGFALEVGLTKFGEYKFNTQSVGLYNYLNPNTGVYRSAIGATNASYAEGYSPEIYGDDRNIFKKKEDGSNPIFNCIFIVKDGQVSFFYKESDEPDTELATPKVVVDLNGTTDGFCGIVGDGNLTFRVDNYSVTNLDFDVKGNTYLSIDNKGNPIQNTTRADFTSISSYDGLSLFGASFSNKQLKINDEGFVKSVGKTNNGIFRIKTSSIEDTLSYNLGNLKVNFIDNESGKKIDIYDGSTSKQIILDSSFSFDGATFEIWKLSNTLKVYYASGNKPLSSILTNVNTFTLNLSNDFDYFTLTSDGISCIKNITYIGLDTYQHILPRDYDESKDTVVVWVYRPTEEEAGKTPSSNA